MRRKLFLAELAAAGGSSLLAAITIAWPEWIEVVFRIDPDHGSGLLELVIACALAAVAVASALAARAARHRYDPLARVG